VTSWFTCRQVLIRCPTVFVVEKKWQIIEGMSGYTSLIEHHLNVLRREGFLLTSL
jgi:hypothetical protein